MKITVKCPAKINTFLSVGPPDSTGYHPIRTVFQAISIFDELALDGDAPAGITCDWPDLPEENTLTKTLRLLREVADVPPLAITLKKSIPAESGLGGGSSDAAGLLRGLLKLGLPGLGRETAHEIAAAVGADVPFFLVGGKAKGEGYGTSLVPLPNAPTRWLVVAKPAVGVSTREAYRALDAAPRSWREFPADDAIYNDFARVAPCASLEIIERLQSLGSQEATLCGSGSACVGLFETEVEAIEAASSLSRSSGLWVRVAKSLSREESLSTS